MQGNHNIARGTVIATFDADGRYGNHTSHAAIHLYPPDQGIEVINQWKGMPAHERTIYFNQPNSHVVDQGENYYVVD